MTTLGRVRFAVVGAAAVAAYACAVTQQPPGGPPDFDPPVIVSVLPDSGSIVDGLDDPLVIQFDEVIAETSGGGLDRLIELSPRPDELEVKWRRTRVTVEPKGGWRANVVYHVVLLPGVTDLRSNRMEDGRTVVFSSGGPIPETTLSGVVVDWDGNRPGADALIEAVLMPDSLVYVGRADSTGAFTLTALPVGAYVVYAAVDGNTNGRRESREAFDSVAVRLDSAAQGEFWAFVHDTLGPTARDAASLDSMTVRVQFTQKLDPAEPSADAVQLFLLPDTTPVPVAAVWTQTTYDSVSAAEAEAAREREDSLAAAGDSAAVAGDSAAAAEAPEPPGALGVERGVVREAAQRSDSVAPADSTAAQRLLVTRPRLYEAWVVRTAAPLSPSTRYLVLVTARNPGGASRETMATLVTPASADST